MNTLKIIIAVMAVMLFMNQLTIAQSSDQMNKTADSMVKAWNTNDFSYVEAVTVKDLVRNTNGERVGNSQSDYKAMMNAFHTAYPDLHIITDKIEINGATLYAYWTLKGTNTGVLNGNVPTGKKMDIVGHAKWTFNKDGKAIQEDVYSDNLIMFMQLGYDLTPPQNKEQTMKKATQDYITAWSTNDFNLMKSVTSADLVRNANGEITSGNQAEIGETMKFWHTAIPDFNLEQGAIIIKDGKSYSSWTSTGTNTGMFGDAPPTGKSSKNLGFTVLTFNDAGKIIHEQAYYDLLSTLDAWGYSVTSPGAGSN